MALTADTSSLEDLRTLYHELSAAPRPYFKSTVKLRIAGTKGWVTRTIVHDHPKPDITAANFPGLTEVKILKTHVEKTVGLLYGPQVSTQPQHYGSEWALCFKIDCDLAMKKTGSIDAVLREYLTGSDKRRRVAPTPQYDELTLIKREAGAKGGRPPKPASLELLEKHGRRVAGVWDRDCALTAWLLDNMTEIDSSEEFTSDEYRSGPQGMQFYGGLIDAAPDSSRPVEYWGDRGNGDV